MERTTNVDCLNARFSIRRHPDVRIKPIYAYKYKITGITPGASDYLCSRQALNEMVKMFIADKKPENAHYVLGDEYLFSQFKFDLPSSVEASLRLKGEIYEMQFKQELEMTIDPHSGKTVDEFAITEALKLMIQAGIEEDNSFHVANSPSGVEVFKFASDEGRGCVIYRTGLNLEVKSNGFALIAAESRKFFYNPINVTELFYDFKFRVSKRLTPYKLKFIETFLKNRRVWAIFPDGEVSVHRIARMSTVPMCDDCVICPSDTLESLVKLVSVEERLKQEHPNLRLKYKSLPCLISTRDKHLPMEVCWVVKGQEFVTEAGHKLLAGKGPSVAERKKIFADNCNKVYLRSCATLRNFGFQIVTKRAAQSGLLSE